MFQARTKTQGSSRQKGMVLPCCEMAAHIQSHCNQLLGLSLTVELYQIYFKKSEHSVGFGNLLALL